MLDPAFSPVGQEDGSSTETSDMGDMDARLLWLARVSQKSALAFGLEATIPTATNVRLGSGKYTLGPKCLRCSSSR